MRSFPFISPAYSLIILRVVVALLLIAHGVARLSAGTVGGFGEFLSSKGFPAGTAIAWFLTIFELAGGLMLAAGFFTRWIAAIFMIEIAMGIVLVHAKIGWFVVGHQTGGAEYSVLLIIVLLVVAATSHRNES